MMAIDERTRHFGLLITILGDVMQDMDITCWMHRLKPFHPGDLTKLNDFNRMNFAYRFNVIFKPYPTCNCTTIKVL